MIVAESGIPDVVERLRTLLAKATPGPWKADRNLGCKRISAKPRQYGQHKQAKRTEVASTPGLHSEAEDQANADLIAEVVTALPMLLDALSHTPRPVEWQAIETAPRDECVLITRDTEWPEELFHVAFLDGDGWQVHAGKSDHPLRGPDPTHWMALPAPPRSLAIEEGEA